MNKGTQLGPGQSWILQITTSYWKSWNPFAPMMLPKLRVAKRFLLNRRSLRLRTIVNEGPLGGELELVNLGFIYEIDDKKQTILVLHIGHRRDIYR